MGRRRSAPATGCSSSRRACGPTSSTSTATRTARCRGARRCSWSATRACSPGGEAVQGRRGRPRVGPLPRRGARAGCGGRAGGRARPRAMLQALGRALRPARRRHGDAERPRRSCLRRAGPQGAFVLCAGRLWDEAKNLAALERAGARACRGRSTSPARPGARAARHGDPRRRALAGPARARGARLAGSRGPRLRASRPLRAVRALGAGGGARRLRAGARRSRQPARDLGRRGAVRRSRGRRARSRRRCAARAATREASSRWEPLARDRARALGAGPHGRRLPGGLRAGSLSRGWEERACAS